MNPKYLALLALLLSPAAGFAQKKEYVELQRDVSLLQDQMRTMQRGQDEKFAALEVLLKQIAESSNRSNTAVAVLESKVTDKLVQQEKQLALPLANMGTKVDAMGNDFGGVREAIHDLESKIGKMQGQLVDLSSLVKLINEKPLQAPPPPVQPNADPAKPGATLPAGCTGTAAEDLFNNAMRDRQGGNSDLAVQEFQDVLKCYGSTDYAPSSLYYIGVIYYLRGDHENAISTFDKVLSDYPGNAKVPDTMLLKGRALARIGQKEDAKKEFKALIAKFPDSDSASKARVDLNATSAAKPAPSTTKKKKR